MKTKFTCENLKCLHVWEREQLDNKKGRLRILVGCLCPKCGWHMVADPVK